MGILATFAVIYDSIRIINSFDYLYIAPYLFDIFLVISLFNMYVYSKELKKQNYFESNLPNDSQANLQTGLQANLQTGLQNDLQGNFQANSVNGLQKVPSIQQIA